jgi:hypothetical protein
MNNGRFEKYFFNEKFRKLFVATNENTVMNQAKQNKGVSVTQITFTKKGRIKSKATRLINSGTLFING